MKKIPMTVEGAKRMKAELTRLETVERPQIIRAIAEARAHGDLKENAEYHAAKEKQGFIEAHIRNMQHKLSYAQVIDLSHVLNEGRVVFGATVKLLNLENNETVSYKIVGEDEADVKEKKISVASPVARAVIGKQVGEEVIVETPAGAIPFEILVVDYIE